MKTIKAKKEKAAPNKKAAVKTKRVVRKPAVKAVKPVAKKAKPAHVRRPKATYSQPEVATAAVEIKRPEPYKVIKPLPPEPQPLPPKPAAPPKPLVPPQPIPPKPIASPQPLPPKPAPPKHAPKPHAAIPKPVTLSPQPAAVPTITLKEIELKLPVTLKDLGVRLQEKPSALIKILMDNKIMAGINQTLDDKTVTFLCEKLGFKIKRALSEGEAALIEHEEVDLPKDLCPRPPIVTFMGHVDHGKTSLLDAIRKTKVAESEHGGITQHIGAYRVLLPTGEITFLDTPGHEAFTAMRARGASSTDIVVLVVAADDGVMPQTREAIDHARAADVPIVVALNKIDKPQADIDRIKKQLSELNLLAEDWGGKTITAGVSAKTGQGMDQLLEMILLEAQMLELKANPNRQAKGVVIEAKMSKGRGPVSTLLVKNGTLRLNQNIIVGKFYGKVRAMFDDRGRSVTAAGPSVPVEVLGISGVPLAGDQFFVIEDEKLAKEIALGRQEHIRQAQIKSFKKISLEELHAQIERGEIKDLKIILKADVQGSLEAIKDTLNKLNVSEIKMDIIHEGVGNINASDVILAVASNALILGFNMTADDLAKDMAEKEGVDIRTYNIIYELANDIKAAIEGMLEPKLKKVFLGRAEIRKVLKLSRAGIVAGCFVTKGKINRACNVTLLRNGEAVFEGGLSSLKRFKDDVRDVQEGFECGMSISGFDAIQEGDIIEAYEIEKIARKL
ncbi:MAG: translation initiation factor IF-2 [Candidatus Omnitrophota bacterium]